MTEYKTPDSIRLRPMPDGYVHPDFEDPYIVCAAQLHQGKDGPVTFCGARHFSPAMGQQLDAAGLTDEECCATVGGFIDQLDRFWNREEALHIMRLTGQRIKDEEMCNRRLYSEGLY